MTTINRKDFLNAIKKGVKRMAAPSGDEVFRLKHKEARGGTGPLGRMGDFASDTRTGGLSRIKRTKEAYEQELKEAIDSSDNLHKLKMKQVNQIRKKKGLPPAGK